MSSTHPVSSRCLNASWRREGFRCCCRHWGWDTLRCPQGRAAWREVRGSAGCWGRVASRRCLTSPGSGKDPGSAPETGIYCEEGRREENWLVSSGRTRCSQLKGMSLNVLPWHFRSTRRFFDFTHMFQPLHFLSIHFLFLKDFSNFHSCSYVSIREGNSLAVDLCSIFYFRRSRILYES